MTKELPLWLRVLYHVEAYTCYSSLDSFCNCCFDCIIKLLKLKLALPNVACAITFVPHHIFFILEAQQRYDLSVREKRVVREREREYITCEVWEHCVGLPPWKGINNCQLIKPIQNMIILGFGALLGGRGRGVV